MTRLLHDRYLMMSAAEVCDLATGDVMPLADASEPRIGREPSLPGLIEVFDHGRDGCPRSVAADVGAPGRWKTLVGRIADDAAGRGYVPIGALVYERLISLLADEIRDRTLVLIAGEREMASGRRGLLDAVARAPRPHVLLTLRLRGHHAEGVVREARAAYSAVPRPRPPEPIPRDVAQHLQRALRADEWARAGRHAAAERLWRDVAAALARRTAWSHAAAAYVSLGRLLLERGRAADAGAAFEEASTAAVKADDESIEAGARLWLAAARTDAARFTAAEAVCRGVLLAAVLSDGQRAWAHALLARVLLAQARTDEALALPIDTGASICRMDEDTRAFVVATRVRVLLVSGCLFDAGLLARALLDATADAAPSARTIGLTAHLRVLAASGDLAAAEARLRDVEVAAAAARAPLRLARARLVWADALHRAGRVSEARGELRRLMRVGRVAPPLLRRAIEQRMTTGPTNVSGAAPAGRAELTSAAELIRLIQEEEDEQEAVRRALHAAALRLDATRIDLWSADAGPVSAILTTGTGLRSTIGGRVLEAGITIGPDTADPASQVGVPVRIGSRLLAAIVARWPADRTPPADAASCLALVAAVAAPRVDAMLHRGRAAAQAALVMPEFVGSSRAMADVRQAVSRAATAPFAVLIEGESGVGKELIARALHHLGPRRERRFCDVNCAALPDELLESELFGHARGAFTGAVADRAGLFEEAHGGTLFLDEVADLSARAQAKLLRVVQQHEVRRVGESFARPVDVRLVTAANRNMREEASAGHFRQDLLYRIDVIRINVPALRDRPEDIPVLTQHFWEAAANRVGTTASLAPAVFTALASYSWPGNVRELQNVIAALAVAAPPRGRASADLLPAAITGATPIRTSRLADARDQFERRFIEAALARAGGNRARAARALGLSRQGLIKLIARLGLAS